MRLFEVIYNGVERHFKKSACHWRRFKFRDASAALKKCATNDKGATLKRLQNAWALQLKKTPISKRHRD